mgnify:CR=1 FL=1
MVLPIRRGSKGSTVTLSEGMLVDTRGDGKLDAKLVDSNGDGRPDKIVYLNIPETETSAATSGGSTPRPSLLKPSRSNSSRRGSKGSNEGSAPAGAAARRSSRFGLSAIPNLLRRNSSARSSSAHNPFDGKTLTLTQTDLEGFSVRKGEESAPLPTTQEEEARQRRRSILTEVQEDARIPWEKIVVGDLLGSGATGIVCRGEFASTPVAVKILHQKQSDQDMLARLAKECQLMLKLRHPNVLMTMGFASDCESKHGMVIELIEGGSLRELLDSSKELSWRSPLLDIARGVARGVAYLHDRKVVHRDLKPGNVMLTPAPQYFPKVCDFSESRQCESSQTMTVAGTPSFVAPEVLRQERSGPGSDVWSFGAMLCHMASRKPPYSVLASSVPSFMVMQQVASGQLTPSKEIKELYRLKWPDGLWDVVLRCEESDPEERPSFETLVAELSGMGAAKPTSTSSMSSTTSAADPDAEGGSHSRGGRDRRKSHTKSFGVTRASRKGRPGDDDDDERGPGSSDRQSGATRERGSSLGPPLAEKSGFMHRMLRRMNTNPNLSHDKSKARAAAPAPSSDGGSGALRGDGE